jgi:hypothetical protein
MDVIVILLACQLLVLIQTNILSMCWRSERMPLDGWNAGGCPRWQIRDCDTAEGWHKVWLTHSFSKFFKNLNYIQTLETAHRIRRLPGVLLWFLFKFIEIQCANHTSSTAGHDVSELISNCSWVDSKIMVPKSHSFTTNNNNNHHGAILHCMHCLGIDGYCGCIHQGALRKSPPSPTSTRLGRASAHSTGPAAVHVLWRTG